MKAVDGSALGGSKRWLAFFILGLLPFAATPAAAAPAANEPAAEREFWVRDRRVHAVLRASGPRTLIYVEDKFGEEGIPPEFVARLTQALENVSPPNALFPHLGIVPLEEKIFGGLPRPPSTEERLVLLFADLENQELGGFFQPYDQMPAADAERLGQHSNEANVIYLNGIWKDEEHTLGVIAHELQHLLSHASRPASAPAFDPWLNETLGEGAMLLTGLPTDQEQVNRFAENSGEFPLVSKTYVQYGPQLLFSSFLIDSLPRTTLTSLARLSRSPLAGRNAVEQLFLEQTGVPFTFDLIFGSFVSYVFEQSKRKGYLPLAWAHQTGLLVPDIQPYLQLQSASVEMKGWVTAYGFVAIDLAEKLAPEAKIEVERVDDKNESSNSDPLSCARTATVLWKPISPTRITLYAVGCEHKSAKDRVQFRLRIVNNPSRLRPKALKLAPLGAFF